MLKTKYQNLKSRLEQKVVRAKSVPWALTAVMGLLLSAGAHALSLGPLAQYSVEGEPLRAEIEIIEKFPGEAEGQVELSIASQSEHRKAGLRYQNVLGQLRFEPYRRSDNRLFLRVSTAAPVAVKQFDMLLSVRWAGQNAQKKTYTFALKPGRNADAVSVVTPAAPVTTPAATDDSVARASAAPTTSATPTASTMANTATANTTPSEAAAVMRAGPNSASDSSGKAAGAAEKKDASANKAQEKSPSQEPKGTATDKAAKTAKAARAAKSRDKVRITKGSTLSSVASSNRLPGISLEQMSAAIFQNNPSAFIAGNINRLRLGRTLNLPSRTQAQALSRTEARELLQVHSKDFNDYRQKLAGKATQITQEGKATTSGGSINAGVVDAKENKSPDRLALSTNPNPNPTSDEAKIASTAQKALETNLASETNDITKELQALHDQVKDSAPDGSLPPAPAIDDKSAAAPVSGTGSAAPSADSIQLTPKATQTEGGAKKGFFEDFWDSYKYAILVFGLGLALIGFLFMRRDKGNLAGINGQEESAWNEETDRDIVDEGPDLDPALQAEREGDAEIGDDDEDVQQRFVHNDEDQAEGSDPDANRKKQQGTMADYDLTTLSLDLDEPSSDKTPPKGRGTPNA